MELISFNYCQFNFKSHTVIFYPVRKGYRVEVTETRDASKVTKYIDVLNTPSLHTAETLILKLFKD